MEIYIDWKTGFSLDLPSSTRKLYSYWLIVYRPIHFVFLFVYQEVYKANLRRFPSAEMDQSRQERKTWWYLITAWPVSTFSGRQSQKLICMSLPNLLPEERDLWEKNPNKIKYKKNWVPSRKRPSGVISDGHQVQSPAIRLASPTCNQCQSEKNKRGI